MQLTSGTSAICGSDPNMRTIVWPLMTAELLSTDIKGCVALVRIGLQDYLLMHTYLEVFIEHSGKYCTFKEARRG